MKEEIPPRRVLLRSALVFACSLCLPPALSGCDNKKDSNAKGAVPAGPSANSSAAGPGAAAPSAAKKLAKASVKYQMQPNGDQKCSLCQFFIAESKTCQLVEGDISPDGWCVQWAKKI